MSAVEAMAMRFLRFLPPEKARGLSLRALPLLPVSGRLSSPDSKLLETRLPNSGLVWSNPVGLAAGFDKDAQAISALSVRGFGSLEFGTVTPEPQSGNSKPRLFRLRKSGAIINRLGFPGLGLESFVERLRGLEGERSVCIGANIGANANSKDRVGDYVACMEKLAPLADYLAVNISSPNTLGLRELQKPGSLQRLLDRLDEVWSGLPSVPVFLKLSPDMEDGDIARTVELALGSRCVSGLILSNTTLDRPAGLGRRGEKPGGLSGKPLFERSTRLLKQVAWESAGRLDLIGVGGVSDAETAYVKIRSGAHAVQLYTALTYAGPELVGEIKRGLEERLQRDGFSSISEAVGADLR